MPASELTKLVRTALASGKPWSLKITPVRDPRIVIVCLDIDEDSENTWRSQHHISQELIEEERFDALSDHFLPRMQREMKETFEV